MPSRSALVESAIVTATFYLAFIAGRTGGILLRRFTGHRCVRAKYLASGLVVGCQGVIGINTCREPVRLGWS